MVYGVVMAQNIEPSLKIEYESAICFKVAVFAAILLTPTLVRAVDTDLRRNGLSLFKRLLVKTLFYLGARNRKIGFLEIISLTSRETTLQHDKIYALLGLLAPDLASKIVPSYSDSISKVFREFAFHCMEFYSPVRVLHYACTTVGNELGLPSWVPMFGTDPQRTVMLHRGFHINDKVPTCLNLTPEGYLGINAGFFDRIEAVTHASLFVALDNTLDGPGFLRLRNSLQSPLLEAFHHQVARGFFLMDLTPDLRPYAGGGTFEDNYWRFMSGERTTRSEIRPVDVWLCQRHIDEIRNWYLRTIREFNNELDKCNGSLTVALSRLMDPITRNAYRNSAVDPSIAMSSMITKYQECVLDHRNRYFFRTSRGYFGILNGENQPQLDDMVYLIAGTNMPYVVRPVTTVDSTKCSPLFSLVGSAYIQGTMLRKPRLDQANEEVPMVDPETCIHPQMTLTQSWNIIWLA